MGIGAILLGYSAINIFKSYDVEEGRGPALAGIVIGAIGLIAQVSYIVYFLRAGIPLAG
jgi:hypothetical protein